MWQTLFLRARVTVITQTHKVLFSFYWDKQVKAIESPMKQHFETVIKEAL